MLGGKAGVAARRADMLDAKRAAGDHGQAQGSAQDLAATFTVSAVDDYSVPYTRVSHGSPMPVHQADPIDMDQRRQCCTLLRSSGIAGGQQ